MPAILFVSRAWPAPTYLWRVGLTARAARETIHARQQVLVDVHAHAALGQPDAAIACHRRRAARLAALPVRCRRSVAGHAIVRRAESAIARCVAVGV